MTRPLSNTLWLAGAALAACFVSWSSARADLIEDATTACKTKANIAQIGQFLANHDMRSYRRLVDAKTKIGDCKPLKAHTDVKIERSEGNLACIKAKGDSRCAWVLETALQITSEQRQPVRQDYFACKSPLYLDAGRKIIADNDQEAIKRFRSATSQSGQCLTLRNGERVDVEKRNDKIFCVRPPGEDQCYWTDSLALPASISEAVSANTQSEGPRGGNGPAKQKKKRK
jgi:hypothetical protein